ncbi:hypothetical protein Noda2021_04030 [Candidatus Dependentiae bacterium Noda2021]|nr:hypothetical protein Noda2021_04030 [Candidatus Dependentiae bacterium Noda2021]
MFRSKNRVTKTTLFVLLCSVTCAHAKFVSVPDKVPQAYCSLKDLCARIDTNQVDIASTISVHDLIVQNSAITYTKCHDSMQFNFDRFPLASTPASSCASPVIPETFILSIPNGRAYSSDGVVLVNNQLIQELIWPWSALKRGSVLQLNALPPVKHIAGKVAVITQEGHANYYHWMTEVLPKLAMLADNNSEYDWLYVTAHTPVMRQTLEYLGVDLSKVLPIEDNTYIEADELIVPSPPAYSCYTPQWIIEYLNTHFMPHIKENSVKHNFNKKIFISRKHASFRRIINEDEVFDLFEARGFERYNLEDLSLIEQIVLFHNAEIIVAPMVQGLLIYYLRVLVPKL